MNTITLSRISQYSGKLNTMTLNISPEAFLEGQEKRKGGMLIQDAYPTLTPAEREFLISGMTQQEWTDCFGTEDEA